MTRLALGSVGVKVRHGLVLMSAVIPAVLGYITSGVAGTGLPLAVYSCAEPTLGVASGVLFASGLRHGRAVASELQHHRGYEQTIKTVRLSVLPCTSS